MSDAPVDQAGRRKAALLIRNWLEGSITNYELDDKWPWSSLDKGVVDVGKEIWRYYDDFPERPLSTQELSKDETEVLQRCWRFLETQEPYLDPEAHAPSAIFGHRLWARLFRAGRDMLVVVSDERRKWWPFADKAQ